MKTRSEPLPEHERLLTEVARAEEAGVAPSDLVAMLARLVAIAPPQTDAWVIARLRLAELGVSAAPWLAARFSHEVLRADPSARAWGVQALALSLLGHYRASARAYRQAIRLAPHSAVYRHNLGHLLDLALGRPADAIPHLRWAHQSLPNEPEVASSYAHALARTGKVSEATSLLEQALSISATEAHAKIVAWSTYSSPQSPLQ